MCRAVQCCGAKSSQFADAATRLASLAGQSADQVCRSLECYPHQRPHGCCCSCTCVRLLLLQRQRTGHSLISLARTVLRTAAAVLSLDAGTPCYRPAQAVLLHSQASTGYRQCKQHWASLRLFVLACRLQNSLVCWCHSVALSMRHQCSAYAAFPVH